MIQGTLEQVLSRIRWLGHAGFLIEDSIVIYIDPVELGDGLPIADIVLITRNHPERCSVPDVMKVSKVQTVVAGPPAAVCRFRLNQIPLSPGQTQSILGLRVTAVGGTAGGDPSAEGELGYVLELGEARIFHPGSAGGPDIGDIRANVVLSPESGQVVKV